MKRVMRALYCGECGFVRYDKFHFLVDSVNTVCPECGYNEMHLKIQLQCVEDSCKRFTVVQGDPNGNNPNYYNKKYGSFDIRNFSFVCPDHQKAYEKHYEKKKHQMFNLKKGHALI